VSLLVWVVRTVVDHRRWLRQSRVQVEVHTKLLDRLTSNDDLLAYAQTPAGSRFLESAPLELGAQAPAAPLGRIIWSVQAGVVLIVLGIGVFRGRQRGMSEELLGLFQWLAIVVGSALAYRPLGKMIAASTEVTLLMAYIGAYLLSVIGIKILFSWIRKIVGEKLVGGDLFGGAEFYLGMLAGAVRCGCMLIVILAMLHAKNITSEQLAKQAKMQKDNFGDISFPTFGSVQHEIFYSSLSGKFIGRHLSDQLIQATAPEEKLAAHESLRERRQRELDEVFGSKK
jgi:uncharacterized membrane protein required for colicin V production